MLPALLLGLLAAPSSAADTPVERPQVESLPVDGSPVDFGREVLPLLSELCFGCHGPDAAARQAGLRLDVRDEALFVVEPGDPGASELVRRLLHENPERRMPPAATGKTATPDQIALLARWIEEGARWTEHWAFVPPVAPPRPACADDPWCRDPLDAFVLERLRAAGLEPSPAADDATWRRRAALDLTGLPPAADAPPGDAALVEALLATRARAEHRTREWLDLARYADTNGYQNDFRRDQWPWRDWVLRAFEANLPYDDFVLWQTAGDLLPDATLDQVLATGFNRNHRTVTEAGSLDEEWRVENVADRAETTATAFLGLTLACARCHDHKYDPLSQRDYYSFYAFFDQVDEQGVYQETRGNVPPLVEVPSPDHAARIAAADALLAEAERTLEATAAEAPARAWAWAQEPAPARSELGEEPVLTFGYAAPVELSGVAAEAPDLGRAVAFEQDRPFTVSLWLRPESSGAVYSRMADDDTYRGTDLILLGDMRPAVHLIHSWTQNAIKVVGLESLEVGRWHHLAVSYDGARKAAGVTLFVDGERVEVTVEADSLDGTLAVDEPLRVGRRRYAGELRGAFRDLRVDAAALGRDDVRALAETRARRALASSVAEEAAGAAQAGTPAAGLEFYRAVFDGPTRTARAAARAARRERDGAARDVPTAMVLRDRAEPRLTRLLDRGRYDRPVGDALAPDAPRALGGLPDGAPRNRLGLARWLVDPANPLTARVAANRAWASFFGRGLVATPEDLGVRGERPVHAALLDHLAVSLVESGWDLAALERRIALSATYRQTSRATPALRERDPENRLLARGPRHRLAAEVVRDQALAAAGLLRPRFGGPSVKPYQPAGLWKELAGGAGQGAYVPSEGDDLFRRSVYTYRKRTVPHPTLTTFDAPGFELCVARRAATNTPLQALALMNDVTYVEAARHLGARMRGAGDERAGLALGLRAVLARAPREAELEVLAAALASHRESFAADPAAADAYLAVGATPPGAPPDADAVDLAAWSLVASTILNLDEAVTKR